MPNRSQDWFAQAEQARQGDRHEWACFAARQAAEKAVKALHWDTAALPVPVQLLVYTRQEWNSLAREGGRFFRCLQTEAVWVWGKPPFMDVD